MRRLIPLLLASAFFFSAAPFAFAAISFDTSQTNNTTTSYTYTPGTLTNGAIVATCYSATATGDAITAVTYGGVSMTLVDKNESAVAHDYMFVLAGPAAGAQTVTPTNSVAGHTTTCQTASYNGVNQASPIDSHSNGGGSGQTSPLNMTTTVVASNAWLVGGTNEQSFVPIAGTATTRRQVDYFDSNATVGTGSQSLNITWTGGSQGLVWTVASLNPAAATAASRILASTTWW